MVLRIWRTDCFEIHMCLILQSCFTYSSNYKSNSAFVSLHFKKISKAVCKLYDFKYVMYTHTQFAKACICYQINFKWKTYTDCIWLVTKRLSSILFKLQVSKSNALFEQNPGMFENKTGLSKLAQFWGKSLISLNWFISICTDNIIDENILKF